MAMAEEGEGRHPLGIPLAPIRLTHTTVACDRKQVVGLRLFLRELVLCRR